MSDVTIKDNKTETHGRFLGLERAEWWFWLKWILANGIAFVGGWWLGTIPLVLVTLTGSWTLPLAASSSMTGLVYGVAQWLVLRRRLQRSGWWVLANAVVWVLVWIVYQITVRMFAGKASGPLIVAIMEGATLGAVQWLVLRKRVQQSGWWVLTNAAVQLVNVCVTWLVGFHVNRIVFDLVFHFVHPTWEWNDLLARKATESIGDGMGWIVTGIVLILLLRHPISGNAGGATKNLYGERPE